jgi:hypothetical protein
VLGRGAEAPRELPAGADAKLGVRPGQVRLDGGDAEVQLRGDLLVRQAAGRQLGDPPLAGGQAAARYRPAAADPVQLGGRRLGPARAAQLPESGLGPLQRLAGGAAFLGPALDPAQYQQRPGRVNSSTTDLCACRSHPRRRIHRGACLITSQSNRTIMAGQQEHRTGR